MDSGNGRLSCLSCPSRPVQQTSSSGPLVPIDPAQQRRDEKRGEGHRMLSQGEAAVKAGDGDRAIRLYQQVIALLDNDKGSIEFISANVRIGTIYQYGLGGIPVDYDTAFKWYEKGEDFGALAIARMYIGGIGRPKDLTQARYWMTKSHMPQARSWIDMYDAHSLPPGDGVPTFSEAEQFYTARRQREEDNKRAADAIEAQRQAQQQVAEAERQRVAAERDRVERVQRYNLMSPAERLHADPLD